MSGHFWLKSSDSLVKFWGTIWFSVALATSLVRADGLLCYSCESSLESKCNSTIVCSDPEAQCSVSLETFYAFDSWPKLTGVLPKPDLQADHSDRHFDLRESEHHQKGVHHQMQELEKRHDRGHSRRIHDGRHVLQQQPLQRLSIGHWTVVNIYLEDF